jgi:NAD(P)-dependent dehydrogenase (short-subunit alcohol dehydrogenase family)
MRLEGKVAIVTGGASGIGAATCRFFAREGMKGVAVADINDELGTQVAHEIEEGGGHAFFVKLDVIDEQQWQDAAHEIEEGGGHAFFVKLDVIDEQQWQDAAIQYASEYIRVNSIHPGFADTGMTRELHAQPDERERRLSVTPLGRMGTPEDMAWGCVYLASWLRTSRASSPGRNS